MIIIICLIEFYYLTRYNKWLNRAHALNDRYKRRLEILEPELLATAAELEKYKQMYRESERVRKKLYMEVKHNDMPV